MKKIITEFENQNPYQDKKKSEIITILRYAMLCFIILNALFEI